MRGAWYRSSLPSLIGCVIDTDRRLKPADDCHVDGSAAVPEVQSAWLGDACRAGASSDDEQLALHELPARMVSGSAQTGYPPAAA
jgi:hypothetical protein